MPVYNHVKATIHDDLAWQGCHYAAGNRAYKESTESSYSSVSPFVLSVMTEPVQAAFHLPDTAALNYSQFYYYSDTLVSEVFEGLPKRYPFSELQWELVRNSQEVMLVNSFDAPVRTLWVTKMLRGPLAAMAAAVEALLAGEAPRLKYWVHSAHDTQQWNLVEYLEPVDYEPIDMPYASTVFFELRFDPACLAAPGRSPACFSVHLLNNGELLKLDTCLADNNRDPARISSAICTYPSFLRHL